MTNAFCLGIFVEVIHCGDVLATLPIVNHQGPVRVLVHHIYGARQFEFGVVDQPLCAVWL